MKRQGATSLEEAFIGYLKEVRPSLSEGDGQLQHGASAGEERQAAGRESAFTRSRRRFTAYAYREAMELWRDPIRRAVAFLEFLSDSLRRVIEHATPTVFCEKIAHGFGAIRTGEQVRPRGLVKKETLGRRPIKWYPGRPRSRGLRADRLCRRVRQAGP